MWTCLKPKPQAGRLFSLRGGSGERNRKETCQGGVRGVKVGTAKQGAYLWENHGIGLEGSGEEKSTHYLSGVGVQRGVADIAKKQTLGSCFLNPRGKTSI